MSRSRALLGAAHLSVAPLAVVQSNFGMPDVAAVFFFYATLLAGGQLAAVAKAAMVRGDVRADWYRRRGQNLYSVIRAPGPVTARAAKGRVVGSGSERELHRRRQF
jgi:hypothetical protein